MSYVITLLAQADPTVGLLGGMAAFMIVFWILAIITSVFWLWMLIDALVYEPTTEGKILWFLVVFFLHFLGALIYFFVRRAGRGSTTPVGY
jgi:hypothetical protein